VPSDPIFFETPAQLRDWLDAHHQTADELFVGAWNKSTGKPSLTWPEIVEEALCVGWIDSIRRRVLGDGWTIRLTPRRKGGNWSNVNIAKVEKLTAEGRMRPAGLSAFAARSAVRSGVYSFEQAGEPTLTTDEEARFRSDAAAWKWFAAKPPSFRKQALHWVISAKRPETRERRLATLISDSAAGRPIKPMIWSKADAAFASRDVLVTGAAESRDRPR
jgi:uncharacterized protein YdeI (YjbR/CyaY-like superfamily)